MKYTKRNTDVFYCPSLPQANFLNDTGGAIQALAQKDVLPYCFVKEDFPIILPKRQDEGSSGVGEGVNETVVLENQFEIGAGSIINQAINFLMIAKIGGDVVNTYTAKEIFVITCIADDTSSLNNKYFEFDIQLAANTIKKYFVWFNVAGAGAAPTPAVPYGVAARTAVPVAFAEDATANQVAAAVHTAMNALPDITTVNTGAPSAIVTCSPDQNGGVDDAHDVDSGVTITVTTQGRTKTVITFDAESYEKQNFGFHTQRDNDPNDIMYTLTGCSIAEHTLECGTKGLSPYGNKKEVKNHGWHTVNKNFTLNYTAALKVIWFGFKVFIENLLSHCRDGGGDFAAGVDFNKRNCTITITVQPEDHYLYQMSKLHYLNYANDLLIQIKSMQAADNNVYVQFDCNKCRVIPFDEIINSDGSPEKQAIDLKPCPGATFSYTIEGYLSNEYVGGH
jgi:hypothetical protein